MSRKEITASITKTIVDAGNIHGRLWRNNQGVATFQKGKYNHTVAYGVGGRGGADLIGFRRVGKLAQFVAIEIKSAKSDKLTDQQQNFLRVVNLSGGYGAVANPETATAVAKDLVDKTNKAVLHYE